MQNVTAFVTDPSCDELHCFYLRTFFSFTSSSFSSKDLSRCWGITSLKPFCRARNWASMPCRKRQFTYNLQQTYEREEGEEAQRESVRLVCQIQMCDHDTDSCATTVNKWSICGLKMNLTACSLSLCASIALHTWHTPSWCLLRQVNSCRWVWVHVVWFLRKHCAPHRKCDPGHQWCHCPCRGWRAG